MERFLFPTLLQEEIENLSSPITIALVELVISHPHKGNSSPKWFHWNFLYNIQGRNNSNLPYTF